MSLMPVSPETSATPLIREGSTESEPGDLASIVLVGLITAGGAVLRFLYLDRKSFWLDEGVSVAIARLDRENLFRILWRREANMALYYGLLRGWMHFGATEFFVRSLSVIFSVATIPLIYLLGSRLFGRREGLIAALLLSVHAWHVRYAQEARSYSLFIALVCLSFLFFLRIVERPNRRNSILYILFSALAVYSHFFAIPVLLSQWAAFYLLPLGNAARRRFLRSIQIISLIISPLMIFVLFRGLGPINWISRPGIAELHQFGQFLSGNGGNVLLVLYIACAIFAIYSAERSSRSNKDPQEFWRHLLVAMWLLVPIVLTLGFSLIKSVFLPRYLVMCIPALVLLAASGLSRLRPRWVAALVLAAMLGFSGRGLQSYYHADFDIAREDWRGATQYLLNHSLPEDGVLFHSAQARMPFEYYAESQIGRRQIKVIFPASADKLTYRDFLANAKNAPLAESAGQYRRIWLVLAHNQLKEGGSDLTTGKIEDVLGRKYILRNRLDFPGGIVIQLYGN